MAKKKRGPDKAPRKSRAKEEIIPFTRGGKLSLPDDELSLNTDAFTEITDTKQRLFLQALMTTPRLGAATKMAGVCAKTVWNWRHSDPDPLFLKAYATAYRIGLQVAEAELWRRGVHGVEEPVYHRGRLVGTKRSFDTTAAIFMLKGALPDVYRERQEITGGGGGPIQVEVTDGLSDDEILRRVELVRSGLLGGRRNDEGAVVADYPPSPAERYAEAVARRKGLSPGRGGNGNGSGG
jgi:hypothetical protein